MSSSGIDQVTKGSRRVREPPSVPFLWEEKPGTPKQDWKISSSSPRLPMPLPPPKLIASVPFKWEEQPGKPLPSFIVKPSRPPPPPPNTSTHTQNGHDHNNGQDFSEMLPVVRDRITESSSHFPNNGQDELFQLDLQNFNFHAPSCSPTPPPNTFIHTQSDYGQDFSGMLSVVRDKTTEASSHLPNNDQDWLFHMDFQSFNFQADHDHSNSTLLANCIVSSSAISSAVPVDDDDPMEMETLSSDSDDDDSHSSSTSSYVTGSSSLVGASFLECLFPLLPPNNSPFLHNKTSSSSTNPPTPNSSAAERILAFDAQSDRDGHNNNNAVMVRRPPTLGELIMMSRRRSVIRRTAVHDEYKKIHPSVSMVAI